jgi:hypothetical protein
MDTPLFQAFFKKKAARLFVFARQSVCVGTSGNSENTLEKKLSISPCRFAGLCLYIISGASYLFWIPGVAPEEPSVPANMISSHQLFFGSVDANKKDKKWQPAFLFVQKQNLARVYFWLFF